MATATPDISPPGPYPRHRRFSLPRVLTLAGGTFTQLVRMKVFYFMALFAVAVIAAGDAGKPVLAFCSSLTAVMFKFAGIIMKFAPFGVGAAIAVTVGHQGLGSLLTLGKLVLTLYGALVIFVLGVFGAVIWIARVPLKPFIKAVREPFTLAFATPSVMPDSTSIRPPLTPRALITLPASRSVRLVDFSMMRPPSATALSALMTPPCLIRPA